MMSETNEVEATREKQNGETFSEEMKDYAKSTMNELLGMFGYEEEITREAVEELQIRLLPEEDDNAQSMIDKSVELEKDDSVPVNINAGENTVLVEIPGIENGSKPSVIPVPDINNAAIPNDSVVQPLSEVPINSPVETSKPGTVLAPQFLAEPPNVKGVYCVVANLPVVNSGNKTNMTFKFWNCIMCSEYFVQKPEVIFRLEHPHLFGSHPTWLYQAAVCQKCHQSLKASKHGATTPVTPKEASLRVEAANGSQQSSPSTPTEVVTAESASKVSYSDVVVCTSLPSSLVISTSTSKLFVQSAAKDESKEGMKLEEVLFDCYICSKPVNKNFRHGKLRRSKFPMLFSNLPESVGVQKVCFKCSERLTRQRDRFVHAGIAEENRDYVAHIKIWTGKDFSSKMSPSAVKNGDSSTCFVCEKYLPNNTDQDVRTINRTKFPSLFSVVPGQIFKLLVCDSCHRKLLKVKGRFDENKTVEEERDYWVYINSWRDQKGLENHPYNSCLP